jgi:nicotinamide riboside kinase
MWKVEGAMMRWRGCMVFVVNGSESRLLGLDLHSRMADDRPQNIFIIGAQCTGKTTLLNALKNHYTREQLVTQPTIISEVARTVIKDLNFDREDIVASPDQSFVLQKAILQAQYKNEAVLSDTTTAWYISDRSGIDPIVYAQYYAGVEKAKELLASPQWAFLERQMKAGLVILCEAGVHWLADDGTRLMPKDRTDWIAFDQAFRALLDERGIRYVVIPRHVTDISDRATAVVDAHQSGRRT